MGFNPMYNEEIEKIKTDKEMSEKEKNNIRSKYIDKSTSSNEISRKLEKLSNEIFVINSKLNHILESQKRIESKLKRRII